MLNMKLAINAVEDTLAAALAAFKSENRSSPHGASTGELVAAFQKLTAALKRCSCGRRPLPTQRGPYMMLIQHFAVLQHAVGVALAGDRAIETDAVNSATKCATLIADALDLMEDAQLVAEAASGDDGTFYVMYASE